MAKRKNAKSSQKDKTTSQETASSREKHGGFSLREAIDGVMHHVTMRRLALVVALAVLLSIPLTFVNHRRTWHEVQYRKALKEKNWPEAARRAQAMYRLHPERKINAANSALAWLRAGEPRKAVDILEKDLSAYDIKSTSGSAGLRGMYAALYAWALFDMERASETPRYIERALKLHPNLPITAYVAGRACLERGDPLGAAPFYKKLAETEFFEKQYEAYRRMLEEKVLTVPEAQLAGVPEHTAPIAIVSPAANPSPQRVPTARKP